MRQEVEENEQQVLRKHFKVADNLEEIDSGDTVLQRYSVLPFSEQIREQIEERGASPLQDKKEIEYLNDLFAWYPDLRHMTPTTWSEQQARQGQIEDGPFFVKGQINARKHQFNELSYAPDQKALVQLLDRLKEDPLLGNQSLAVRRFVPLRTYFTLPSGLPISEEYRFFIYRKRVLAGGFYWSEHLQRIRNEGHRPDPEFVPDTILTAAISCVKASFYSLDIARTADDSWVVIEIGDASHSGLCGVDPEQLYSNLEDALTAK